MKTINILFLAVLLLINTFVYQSTPESRELKEALDLTQSAVNLFYERKYDAAISQARKGLEIRERLLPRTDLRISASLIYLGDIYIAKRDLAEAKKILERLLEIQIERSGPEDVSLAPTLDRLAMIYYRENDARKAEEFYQRALAMREKAYGPESARVAEAFFALGQFYRSERDYDRSASNYRRALLIYAKLSGISSSEFQSASDGYACLGYDSKRSDFWQDLKEIWKQFSPPAPPKEVYETRILNGMAISLPKPAYPAAALDRKLAGIVVVKVLIDETGKVIKAQDMCGGPPYLSESAVKAALQARFTPTKLSGMPVKVNGLIQYNFVR